MVLSPPFTAGIKLGRHRNVPAGSHFTVTPFYNQAIGPFLFAHKNSAFLSKCLSLSPSGGEKGFFLIGYGQGFS
jgi:hypothetical protein